MSTPTSNVRKAFFGVWIVAAALLLMVGRAGGAISDPDGLTLAPFATGHLAPAAAMQAHDSTSGALD